MCIKLVIYPVNIMIRLRSGSIEIRLYLFFQYSAKVRFEFEACMECLQSDGTWYIANCRRRHTQV